ncbi:MAG TPA: HypC/HybG/HupF family hydrogenase formation chaperone [Syntrophomonas sp.]|jgi:hydrogenase expression/formation protein HypC|nr:HypC/HybG/HupF family hydrogenase formation chaperone [Syntrophomonas sp.]
MCLGVPAKVVEFVEGQMAVVDVDGNQVNISIQLTPEVKIGQYVLVHAGFAMDIIDESFAEETMKLLKELQPH